MAADLASVERELCRIPEVRAARIVADDDGTPVEVHVLASPGKQPKQLVRDVQSVALAARGLDLDHRIVSIVQLDDGNGTAPEAATFMDDDEPTPTAPAIPAPPTDRVLLESASLLRSGVTATAEVALRRGEASVRASAEGSSAAAVTLRLVAEATLEALRDVVPAAGHAAVETATVVRAGEHEVALAVLVLVVPPNEEVVAGSAPVRAGGVHEAMARAVLDAGNRRLTALP
ncbi:MAG TPA: hypothetical protein VE395_10095 [Acidimicrobiales bacterium]|nr:hypothetical protein [Acidimicrobiales bacterium]